MSFCISACVKQLLLRGTLLCINKRLLHQSSGLPDKPQVSLLGKREKTLTPNPLLNIALPQLHFLKVQYEASKELRQACWRLYQSNIELR